MKENNLIYRIRMNEYNIVHYINKNKCVNVRYNNKDYTAMKLYNNKYTIIDKEDNIKILNDKRKWHQGQHGYICHDFVYLHNLINNYRPTGNRKNSYDHINRIKTDNRKENLRWTTQTMQNYNYSRPKRDLTKKKYQVLTEEIIKVLNYGQLEKYISYYYENSKNRTRYRISVDKRFPYHNKHKNFDTKEMEKIPEMYEKAKQYKKQLIEQNSGMPENMNVDYELSEEGKRLEKEYYEILNIARQYLDDQ